MAGSGVVLLLADVALIHMGLVSLLGLFLFFGGLFVLAQAAFKTVGWNLTFKRAFGTLAIIMGLTIGSFVVYKIATEGVGPDQLKRIAAGTVTASAFVAVGWKWVAKAD